MHDSSIPILVVTGASGVGKTSAVSMLEARGDSGTACFYFDSIGVPTTEVIERDFGSGERWQADATDLASHEATRTAHRSTGTR